MNESQRFSLSIHNRITEIETVHQEFSRFADRTGIPTAIAMNINLAFDEILTNIISYAYDDEDQHSITVQVERDDAHICVRIIDDGFPFDPFAMDEPDTSLPLEEREIGGLGIHLVRSVMDEVKYARQGNSNRVTLKKYLT